MTRDDFYLEDGLMVLTEHYHRKRGSCCGNSCRHCPFDHIAVPDARRGAAVEPTAPASALAKRRDELGDF